MSYRSHTAAPSRVFDHLYDPVFTTSDPKNVYKENCIALTRSAPIHVYPVYKSMFSELSYHDRNSYAYQKNVLPYFPYSPQPPPSGRVSVTGADRSKFFSNPLGCVRTINVGLMAEEGVANVAETQIVKFQSTSIQTTFRESSAQTRPWLPEITCYADEHMDVDEMPEVVFIADMIETVTYPGLREVEIVERARKRRQWEAALPPIRAAEEIPARVAAVEAFEWEEWIAREKDINECQQARLKIVADLIAKRERKHQDATNQKLENCMRRILTDRKHQKDILIKNYQRNMRKLDLAQRKSSNREKTNDPVVSHYDRKTEYVLPKIKLDAASKKRMEIDYTSEFEARFTTMEQGTATAKDVEKYLQSKKRELWLPKQPTKEVERGVWTENYLKKLHETLKQFRRKKYTKRKLPKCLVYDESASTTESSMSAVPPPDDNAEEIYQNTVTVQKSVKGRAIQSLLLKGMEKYRDVIEEAKETHSIAAIRKLFPKEFSQQIDNQEQILDEYKRIEEALKNDEKLQAELKKVESRDAGNLLNFLEKELHRLDGEKRAHALYLLAERERYSREAATHGKSHFEQQFRNDAITLYLENILLEGVNRATDENSRDLIRKIAKKIDRRASKTVTFDERIEEFSDESNTEDISEDSLEADEIPDKKVVMELLKDDMVPKIMDKINNEHLVIKQRKYLLAAHQDLYKEEFEKEKLAQDKKICVDILNEIIEAATAESPMRSGSGDSRDSKEAENLATQIVEQILNEIVEGNFEFSSTSTENFSSTGSYDGDHSNVQSTSEGESSTENLANHIVRSILDEILENTLSSTTDIASDTY